jgi:hypothetical protein
MEQLRQAEVYGVRPQRTFRQAATRYLNETTKASIRCDVAQLKILEPFVGTLPLNAVHMVTLQAFIEFRKKQGKKKQDNKLWTPGGQAYPEPCIRRMDG